MRKTLLVSIILILALMLVGCEADEPAEGEIENTSSPEQAIENDPTAAEAEETESENTTEDQPYVEPTAGDIVPNPAGGITAGICTANDYPMFPYPDANENDWSLGPEDATVTIIVYSDFQCPYCAISDPQIMKLYEDHADETRLIFRHFPLGYHELAFNAAVTAEYVGDQLGDEAIFEFIGFIFANQSEWSVLTLDQFNDYLLEVLETDFDLEPDDFDAILADETYKANVNEDYTNGTPFVPGTPFVMLNGIPLMYMPVASFDEAWDFAKEFPDTQYDDCPAFTVDREKQYFAEVTTTKGTFTMELFPDSAPTTVNSFIFLAEEGYYDDVFFHRVMPGFVAQTGDPTGSGAFGPGYQFANEIDPSLTYNTRGMVGMANSGQDTNGSQFFITYAPQEILTGGYTIFAYVIEGMDVVESLQPIDPQNPVEGVVPDKILSITITEK